MAPLRFALVIAIVAALEVDSSALSEEKLAELKKQLLPTLSECGAQHGMTLEKLAEFKLQKKHVDDSNKCFFACVYKKIGLLDSEGLFSEEIALKYIADHVEEAQLEDANANAKSCSSGRKGYFTCLILPALPTLTTAEKKRRNKLSMNKEEFSDGEAGCDRAKLLYDCLIKNSALYGVDF